MVTVRRHRAGGHLNRLAHFLVQILHSSVVAHELDVLGARGTVHRMHIEALGYGVEGPVPAHEHEVLLGDIARGGRGCRITI